MPRSYTDKPKGYLGPTAKVDFGKRIARVLKRSQWFDPNVINSMPFTVAETVTKTNLPDRKMFQLAKHMGGAVKWMEERDKFAGMPGALSGARQRALDFSDPGVKGSALVFLDWLQDLPEEQQSTALAVLRGAQTSQDNLSVFAESPLDIEIDPAGMADPDLSLPGNEYGVNTVAALKSLFPDAPVEVGQWQEEFDQVVADIGEMSADRYLKAAEPAITSAESVDAVLSDPKNSGFEKVWKGGATYVSTGFSVAAFPFIAAGETVSGATRTTPIGNDIADSFRAQGIVKAGFDTFDQGMGALDEVGKAGAGLAFEEGTPEYEAARNIIAGIVGYAVLRGASRAVRAAKVGRGAVIEGVAKAELGLDQPLVRVGEGKLRTIHDVAALPITTIDRLAQNMGLSGLFGTTPGRFRGAAPERISRWLQSSKGRRNFVQPVKTLVDKLPKDQRAGAISRLFGEQIDLSTAQDLAEAASRSEANLIYKMQEILTEAPPTRLKSVADDLDAKKARLSELNGEIDFNGEQVNRASQRLDSAKVLYDEIRSLESDIDTARRAGDNVVQQQKRVAELKRDFETLRNEDAQVHDLRAEVRALDARARTIASQEPITNFPRKSVLKAIALEPTTRFERFMHALSTKKIDINKAFDDLPRYPEVAMPGSRGDWQTYNGEIVSKYLKRAGVADDLIRTRLGEIADLKTHSDFFEWSKRIADDIRASLPESTPPEQVAALTRFWDRSSEGRAPSFTTQVTTFDDGATARTPRAVLDKPLDTDPNTRVALPSMSSEFVQTLSLPDVEMLAQTTSGWGALLNKARKNPLTKGPVKVYDFAKGVMHVGTMTLKGPILGLRAPAMTLKIQPDQFLRNTQSGIHGVVLPSGVHLFAGGIPVWPGKRVAGRLFPEEGWELLPEDSRYAQFDPPGSSPESDVGTIIDEIAESGEVSHIYHDTSDYVSGKRAPGTNVFGGAYEPLVLLHKSPEMRQFVRLGLEVDEMLKSLDGLKPNQRIGPGVSLKNLDDLIESAGKTRRSWLEAKRQQILDLTHGDPVLLDAISTGKGTFRTGTTRVSKNRYTGVNQIEEYRSLAEQYDTSRSILEDIRRSDLGDPTVRAEYDAYQSVVRDQLRELRRLEREHGINPNTVAKHKTIPLTDKRAFTRALRDEWRAGRYELPDNVRIDTNFRKNFRNTSLLEDGSDILKAYNRQVYKLFKPVQWADLKATRGSAYYQYAFKETQKLKALGYTDEVARNLGQLRGARRARALMYDLSARTSAQRALKDIFWFAPAYQEVLYTWLYKIPAETGGWAIGAPLLAAKGALTLEMMERFGILGDNEYGDKVIKVPGLSTAIEKLTGRKLPDTLTMNLESFNMVTVGGGAEIGPIKIPVPGLSTPGAFLLGKSAMKYGGPLKALSDTFMPYGADTTVLPTPILYAWEAMFGEPFPLEINPEKLKVTHDRAFDNALQFAYSDLYHQGIKPPKPEDFADEDAYRAAAESYSDQLFDEAKSYHGGISVAKFLGSTIIPAQVTASDSEEAAWQEFEEQVIAPLARSSDEGWNDAQQDKIDAYLEDHPSSLAYVYSYNALGKKEKELPFKSTGEDAFYDRFYTGEMRVLEPQEFAVKLQYMESKRFETAQLNAALDEIAPTRSPYELLTNGFKKQQAIADYQEAMDRYKILTPGVEEYLASKNAAWIAQGEVPIEDFEVQRLSKTIQGLNQLSEFFTGDSGLRSDAYREVLGELKSYYSEVGEFGAPNTKSEKAIGWYFDNVMSPYFEETGALYDEANDRASRGIDASEIYDQIRGINNGYGELEYKGMKLPTPEEMFFGNRNPEEQEAALYNWATKPITWLSNFQREKVGYTLGAGGEEFLDFSTQFDKDFQDVLDTRDVSPSSTYYDQLQQWRTRTLAAKAAELGAEDLFRLNEAAPYVRLQEVGFGSDNQMWKNTVEAAEYVRAQLKSRDLSPKGFSGAALQYKQWLYEGIEQAREQDPEFDRLMEELSFSIPETGNEYREGIPLYEAIFMSNFSTQYLPEALTEVGAA